MMGSPFPPHPVGMQQHPGAPQGHPMAAGMAHNPSQPGAVQGMQHQLGTHMGASGPGQQINPAVVMGGGIPPGAGNPNAHAAMQHLNPAQAHLFQQQHMFPSSPAVQQHMQHQRLQQLQQQQAARQALAAQQGGYQNIGMPMGIQMGMSPQQYAQMRRMPMMGPQQLAQAQLAQQQQGQGMNLQQLALHQQQLQMQQAGQAGQHQIAAQHLQQAQLQAIAAQQHAQAQQAQQHAQQQHQHQAQQQAQQQHQAQQQQQAVQQQQAAQQQAQQAQQAQGQQTPQMGQQQQPQGPQQPGQGGPGANGTPQNQGPQGPTPQPNPQQQPQPPPQPPQVTQAQQQQAQLVAQVQAHQQAAANAAGVASLVQQHQQQQKNGVSAINGMCHLKLMQFQAHLSAFPGPKDPDEDMLYWVDFVNKFFSPKSVLRFTIPAGDNGIMADKQYEIYFVTIARFFYTHFRCGIKQIQMVLDKGTTDKALAGDCHYMENTKASLVYWFDAGGQSILHGILRATFNSEQKFEIFEFQTTHTEEYMSYDMVIQSIRPLHNWIKDWKNLNPEGGIHSPEMSNKKNKQKAYKSPPVPPPDFGLPGKKKHGLPQGLRAFLETIDIMAQMNPLIQFVQTHPGVTPYNALDQFLAQHNGAGPNINGQSMPQGGPRTPSFSQFPIGASPALANQMLPGSPHLGSPVPGHMQAPGMQLQASQQGTSSSGPSANTSPSQNNKRRRSTVKAEDDNGPVNASTPLPVGTPQLNGVTPKAKPPTPRMQKRAKINPS